MFTVHLHFDYHSGYSDWTLRETMYMKIRKLKSHSFLWGKCFKAFEFILIFFLSEIDSGIHMQGL